MLKPFLILLRNWWLLVAGVANGFFMVLTGWFAVIKWVWEHWNSSTPPSEIHRTESEAELNEAKADSLRFRDQLSVIGVAQKLMRDGLALEELLQEKNRIIAHLENTVYEKNVTIENQSADIQAYERMKLGIMSVKRAEQAEEKTGTDKE